MSRPPEDAELVRAMLDVEWLRIHELVRLAEATRTGDGLPDGFEERLSSLTEAVESARASGAWSGLASIFAGSDASRALTRFDADLLALALAPVAWPSLGPRLQSLQPQIGGSWPGLALIQDILMLEGSGEVALLTDRLHATAPLVAGGLLAVEGAAPNETVRPTPALIRAVLGRDAQLAPPPGAHLSLGTAGWESLILPPTTLRRLRDYGAWVRHAERIGGHGPLALFSGPSGTGKTLAARVLATDLAERTGEPWALYSLDLGRIMSKYVGETEANLNALLDAMEGRRAILQIDEADGLLGKRGEVSDARDRYANLEVSHMLARFERHRGPVILTTNLRANVDGAFLRRFQMVIDFPAPDETARGDLWRVLLPSDPGLSDDVCLASVGSAARLSGGAICNAAAYAAVLALDEDALVGLPHIARAVWAELGKDTRQVRPAEIGFLAEHLEARP